MRTTIRIDDELYRRLKARASDQRRPVAELIGDAVRMALDKTPSDDAAARRALPTHGGTGVLPGVDLTSNAALLERMDDDEAVDALR